MGRKKANCDMQREQVASDSSVLLRAIVLRRLCKTVTMTCAFNSKSYFGMQNMNEFTNQ